MALIKNIMLVDDNEMDLFINQKTIERYNNNIRVVYFKNSLPALEYLKISLHEKNLNYMTRPNLLLLDINMPKCNGFEFLDELEKQDYIEVQNLRVFMLSSSASICNMNKAKSHPLCSGYISKPLTAEKLHKAISLDKEYLTEYDCFDADSSA